MHPPEDTSEEEPRANLQGTWADLEEAWAGFTQMEATGWRHLPYDGGLLDQPELLMSNLYRLKTLMQARTEPQNGR